MWPHPPVVGVYVQMRLNAYRDRCLGTNVVSAKPLVPSDVGVFPCSMTDSRTHRLRTRASELPRLAIARCMCGRPAARWGFLLTESSDSLW